MMSASTELKNAIRVFQQTVCADAKAPTRVKAVNTLLNGGFDLTSLDEKEIISIWESIFFALWYAEMGRGCEEIIAAVERACSNNYRLTRIGFVTISKKWYGLDQYRIDKVSHLARHLLTVLIDQQIKLWLKSNKRRSSGVQNVPCKQLLRRTFNDIVDSYGLCYFSLEILADEISRSLIRVYELLDVTVGKFELRANLITFLYRQVISVASNINLDARLLRTFDQYVIKKFIEELLPNESQLTQILVSLRLYQTLNKQVGSTKRDRLSGKCRSLFKRWSEIIQDIHEKCIDGEFFPNNEIPVHKTIKWSPQIG